MANHRRDRPHRHRRRRLILWSLLAVTALLIIAVAGLPVWIGTASGQRFLIRKANEALSPGGIHFTRFSPSWFGPVEILGFSLIDPQGDHVVHAIRAVWDRPLRSILFDRPRYGTLTLYDAQLDVERLADGSVDLHEALRPILKPNPEFALTIKIEGCRFRFRSKELAEPVSSDAADITLHVPPSPDAISWRVDLKGNTATEISAPRFEVDGSFDRWRVLPGELPKLEVSVVGRRWPLAIALQDLVCHARYDGTSRMTRTAGQWSLRGEASLLDLDASGPVLQGDRPQIDRIDAVWDLKKNEAGWSGRKLSLKSALGQLVADGDIHTSSPRTAHVDGQLDLSALARLLPNTLHLRPGLSLEKGTAKLSIHPNSDQKAEWNASAEVSGLIARLDDRILKFDGPGEVSARLAFDDLGSTRVDWLTLKSPFFTGEAHGDFEQGVKATGDFDLNKIKRDFGEWMRLDGLDLAGTGHIEGMYRRNSEGFQGTIQTSFVDIKLQGVQTPRATLQAEVTGEPTGDGWPKTWNALKLTATVNPDARFVLQANREGAAVAISATSTLPLNAGEIGMMASSKLVGHWTAPVLDLSSMTLEFEQAGKTALSLSARGRLDIDAGRFDLQPVEADSATDLALSGEGLHLSGLRGEGPWIVEGSFSGDMARLDGLIAQSRGSSAVGLDGRWTARMSARHDLTRGDRFGGKVEWVRSKLPEATFAWQIEHEAHADRFDLAEFVITGRLGYLSATGRLDDLDGARRINLRGSVAPDWKSINAALPPSAGADAHLEGRPRSFRLLGSLQGKTLAELAEQLEGEVGVDLTGAKLYGMTLGPMPLGLRAKAGHIELIPIDTTLNQGKLRLEAGLDFDADGHAFIKLRPDSFVRDAVINDDVSRTFLAYVAPVLADATRVKGFVDVGVRDGLFPLVTHPGKKTTFEGSVV